MYNFPITRDIKYIEINPSIFENQVKINEKKLKDKYETEKSNYIIEEKRDIYQITTQDMQKANSFKNDVSRGKKFETAAKELFNLTTKDITIGSINKFDLPQKSSKLVFVKWHIFLTNSTMEISSGLLKLYSFLGSEFNNKDLKAKQISSE